MRIFNKSLGTSRCTNQQVETPSWRVEYKQNAPVFRADNGKTVIVEGDLYYCLDKDGKPIRLMPGDDTGGLLKRVYDRVGEDGFVENVEGIYNAAFIDSVKDSVSVAGDAFNRFNLFYCLDKKSPIVSTEFEDILSRFTTIDYDPAVAYCLLILGYPPLKHTPYRGLFRLGIGERLLLQNGRTNLLKAKVKPLNSVAMDDTDLDRYVEILENSLLSRTSQSENWVGLSSGWDSSTVLGMLRKYFDKSRVRPVISAIKLSDGRSFNPYEIEKATKIAEYYGVSPEIAMIDLGDDSLLKLWSETLDAVRSQFIYEYTFLYQAMLNTVREKSQPDAAVLVGSYSDGLHNFGFSQFISLPYLSNDFRGYSDKIRAYLYSPSFLEKVRNNTFENDFAYRLFKWHHQKVEFSDVSSMTEKERIFEYLLSFVLSNSRLPFARIATDPAFTGAGRGYFREWLYENYFKDAVEQINGDNIYFWLTRLYQHFHLQGFEKKAQDAGRHGWGKRVGMPFYDLQIVKFLERMPENWGRGLEWRPTKYPLKYYGRQILKVPSEIIESSLHSYITESESGRNVNMRSEIINNSVLTASAWTKAREGADLSHIFHREWFNIATLNEMLSSGKDEAGSALPLRTLIFASLDTTNA